MPEKRRTTSGIYYFTQLINSERNVVKIEERQRTCSYCYVTFKDQAAFSKHWKSCPTRIILGYTPNTNPTPSERWKQLKETYE